MEIIEWSESLSVGIGKVDEQHRKLIQLMEELDRAIRNNESADVVEDVLTNLFNYAQAHFAVEEELFRTHKYPEMALHELEHQRFIAKAFAFKERLSSKRPGLALELLNFLSSWVLNHIELTDKRYAKYLRDCGVS
ncbi:bacteriohemerythrin [Geomonas sp. Red69]|uniref:Bacteriohemerythrin n=1 Tax=Geomonas diazotrophica TaxID=2843197 RepID=A0ABX8JU25_9BACT|nr:MULTISPECIES: bacteriohemerythrin [Geomonas]MBU5637029.1 bacteriohemerythrin [Geomonas diazotrophica]QWV98925.1 bacteriohemerythrin [Geomonas nitrogeniifigens]QXE88073.1 bacteriohemerythrin [Geomonas nitrogeniifigens]